MAAPSVTQLPDPPSPFSTPSQFSADAFIFVAALAGWTGDINNLVDWLNANIDAREVVNETGTAFNLNAQNSGAYIRTTNGGAKTLTVQPESVTAQPEGASYFIANRGAGDLTIVAGSGVVINGNVALTENATAILQKIGTDTYDLIAIGGDFVTDLTVLQADVATLQSQMTTRIQSVATIADLRALTGLQIGQKVSVVEYTAGTGLGGGPMTAIADTTSVDDGVSLFVTADGRRVIRDNLDALNVEHAGVIQVEFDQTDALQRLLNYATSTGRVIYGTRLSIRVGGLIINNPIRWKGRGLILRLHPDKSNILTVSNSSGYISDIEFEDQIGRSGVTAVTVSTTSDFVFRGIKLSGWADRCFPIQTTCSNISVVGGVVHNCTASDIYIAKGKNIKFKDIVFKDCSEHVIRYGLFGSDPTGSVATGSVKGCQFIRVGNDPILCEINSDDIVVDNCTAENSRNLIKADGGGTPPAGFTNPRNITVANSAVHGRLSGSAISSAINLNRTAGCKVHNCTIVDEDYGYGSGIAVGEGSVVSGCSIYGASDGILADGGFCTISGNTDIQVINDGIRSGFAADGLKNSTVIGNIIKSSSTAIRVSGGANTQVIGNITIGTTFGVRTQAGCDRITVLGNNSAGGAAHGLSGTNITQANNT